MQKGQKLENWKKVERGRVEYDDSEVIVLDENNTVIYRGLEDYEPMKDENWVYDISTSSYTLKCKDGQMFRKICILIIE